MLPGTPRTFIGSTTFVVRGLTDGEDAAAETRVAERMRAVPGVESVTVDVASGVVNVRAALPVDRADIAAAVAAAGFALVP
jgi:copper chaperone CopZ